MTTTMIVYTSFGGEYIYLVNYSKEGIKNLFKRFKPDLDNIKSSITSGSFDEDEYSYFTKAFVNKIDQYDIDGIIDYLYNVLQEKKIFYLEIDGSDGYGDAPNLCLIDITDKPVNVR